MKRTMALILFGIILFSCQRREKINDLINSVHTFPVTKDEDVLSNKSDSATTEVVDGVEYTCAYKSKTIAQSIDDIVAFSPNTGVMYPGSIVKGKSLKDGILNPISIVRNRGKLTISYITFDNDSATKKEISYTDSIDVTNFQNVQNAVKHLTSKLPAGNQVSILSLEKTEAHSLEESFLRLGISSSWLSGSAKAQLNHSFESQSSKYFVKVIQRYYDISFETNYPKNLEPADFFASNINSDEVYKSWGDSSENPLAYIKSVSYGRILLLFIESESSQEDLNGALEATFSSGTVKGQINISAGQKTALENSKINLLSLGGSTTATVKLLSGNKLDSLIVYLQEGANFSKLSPGYPITYVSRYLKNDEAAKLSYTTNYKVRDCKKNPKKLSSITVNFLGIDDDKDDDEPISFTVLSGDKIVGQLLNVGAGVQWGEGSDQRITIPITQDVNEMERNQLKLVIDKSNAHGGGCGQGGGFRFARHTVDVQFKDGTIVNWFDYRTRFRLGNCDSKTETITF